MEKNPNLKKLSQKTKTSLLVVFLFFTITTETLAASTGLNWSNPNKNLAKSIYNISMDTVLNTSTLMQVVGCLGITTELSGWFTGLFSFESKVRNMITKEFEALTQEDIDKLGEDKYKELVCLRYKGNMVMAVSGIDNKTFSTAVDAGYKCPTIQKTEDYKTQKLLQDQLEISQSKEKREACFNGLAYTLAKNELTAMTKETLNWVNSGFSGDPLYVQNITSLTQSIEKNVIESGIERLIDSDYNYPYGTSFSNSVVRGYNSGYWNNSSNFLDSLTSDLSAFLTDEDSYMSADILASPKKRSQYYNSSFSDDFSVGGWDGYLALTQRDNNNPLGFTMQTAQYLSDRIEQQSTETKNEVTQNNGFLSQKTCTLWKVYDKNGPVTNKETNTVEIDGVKKTIVLSTSQKTSTSKTSEYDQCANWKVTTPGSIIKDKVSTYINSPERQLEVADSLNEVLNTLFTVLIEKFRSSGLYNLTTEEYSASYDTTSGYGTNGYDIDTEIGEDYDTSTYYVDSGNSSSAFDILRTLGNTYIHGTFTKIGTWDAENNVAKDLDGNYFYDENGDQLTESSLNIDTGLREKSCDTSGNCTYDTITDPSYYYLVVTTPGKTKLFNNGYIGWADGDRAFWNGSEWQNWKKNQSSPINTRGVIQIQQDYIVATKEILKLTPSVMKKLGELDYCIPGPNPNFKSNTVDTSTNFYNYIGSLSGIYRSSWFGIDSAAEISIAKSGDPDYDDYVDTFDDIPSFFNNIKSTILYKIVNNFGSIIDDSNSSSDEFMNYIAQLILGESTKVDITNTITLLIKKMGIQIDDFYSKYETNFEDIYGTMRNQYNQVENKSINTATDNNTAYLPMIEDGYAATKNMVTKSENIEEETKNYEEEITTAVSNIARLEIIKDQVYPIIAAAQKRRDERLKSVIIPLIRAEYGEMTEDEAIEKYQDLYSDCYDDEYIDYIDYYDITSDSSSETERCNDGIDNDLDGLIDSDDPDCLKYECSDGIDNDRDGSIDSDDSNCSDSIYENGSGKSYIDERGILSYYDSEGKDIKVGNGTSRLVWIGVETNCTDGIDNDGDRLIDSDDTESCTNYSRYEGDCDDGIDNDGDGLIDYNDNDCIAGAIEYTCSDGIDNDGDLLVDSNDPDC